jgi:hypothetical protein
MTIVAPSLSSIAVALADEGVPLHAIARVTRIPSDELRTVLAQAKDLGDIVELPHEDWPPGFPRDTRALALSRMVQENRPELCRRIAAMFRLPPIESELFLVMLQNDCLVI